MKVTRLILLLLLPVCTAFTSPAPKKINGQISGTVVDKASGEALAFATVSVLDTAKKVAAGGMTDEKGTFSVAIQREGNYILKTSYMGYADVDKPVQLLATQAALQMGTIALESEGQQLDEAVVSARRATIERQVDKLVVNVANSIMAENNTALEVLRKSPGIAIDKDGNITLNGQAVSVWVDNRPTQLSGQDLTALLEGTEGASIDKIEIIDQPSSKYDAAGSGGIVNIRTKKNFLYGFNGSVRAGYTQYLHDHFYFGSNGSLNLNYRNDLISAYVNAGARYRKGFSEIDAAVANSADNYLRNEWRHDDDKSTSPNMKAGVDFFIDKKNIVGVIGNFSLRNYDEDGYGHTSEALNDARTNSAFTGANRSRNLNATGNLNYTHYFEESDHELTLNADYLHYANTPKQWLSTIYHYELPPRPDSLAAYTSDSEQFTDVFSGKADYILPIGKTMKLEAGGKMSWSTTDNKIVRMDSLPAGWQQNGDLSNDFTYKENVGALYANYAWQINKQWSIKAGVRWEYTHSEGIWRAADSTTSKNYNDFFPTLFVGYNPADKHNLSVSYTKRIWRPNYWQLNPFRRYMSEYTYMEGNPNLSPQYAHRFNISYTGFHVLNAGLMYMHSNDQITQKPVYEIDKNGNRLNGYRQENFGKMTFLAGWVGLSELPVTDWLLFSISLSGGYNTNEDASYSYSSFAGNLYGNLTFVLDKTWTAEMEGWMQTPQSWGYYKMKASGSLDIGVKKTFWDNKASLSLYLDDVLGTSQWENTMDLNNLHQSARNSWESRSLRASFSYRFGNMANNGKIRKNVGQQEETERTGSGGNK